MLFRVRVRVRVLGLGLVLGLGYSRVLARCEHGLDLAAWIRRMQMDCVSVGRY